MNNTTFVSLVTKYLEGKKHQTNIADMKEAFAGFNKALLGIPYLLVRVLPQSVIEARIKQ